MNTPGSTLPPAPPDTSAAVTASLTRLGASLTAARPGLRCRVIDFAGGIFRFHRYLEIGSGNPDEENVIAAVAVIDNPDGRVFGSDAVWEESGRPVWEGPEAHPAADTDWSPLVREAAAVLERESAEAILAAFATRAGAV